MTLEGFIEKLLSLHNDKSKDDLIVIALEDPSVGPQAVSDISSINPGFDWDKGRIIIHPSLPLFSKNVLTTDAELKRRLDVAHETINDLVDEIARKDARITDLEQMI
jgi:hypothetical protein